jgi:NitT/TauT family transport system ATP-binding protein
LLTKDPELTPAVNLVGVTKAFPNPSGGQLPVLDNFTLSVASGECVALIGPSGCGKTTILRLISGLLTPDAGQVRVLGAAPGEARATKSIGVVFQAPGLLPWRTALANVELALRVNHQHGHSDVALDLLKQVGLDGFEHHLPHQLSGGMQQRVALARALVTQPRLLVMDEPFSAADELTRATLQYDFLRLRDDRGPAVVLVTHSIEEAVRLGDRVVVLSARPARILADLPIDRGCADSSLDSEPVRNQAGQIRKLLAGA